MLCCTLQVSQVDLLLRLPNASFLLVTEVGKSVAMWGNFSVNNDKLASMQLIDTWENQILCPCQRILLWKKMNRCLKLRYSQVIMSCMFPSFQNHSATHASLISSIYKHAEQQLQLVGTVLSQ